MNNSFSLQQIHKTTNLDAILRSRQYKLNLMSDYMQMKYENPKLKQSEIAKQLGLPSSTIQKYRNDINMLSPYRISSNNTKKRTKKAKLTTFDNNSHRDSDLKRPQMTSNDLKTTSNEPVKNEKSTLKGGGKIEINEHYLDDILQKEAPKWN